MKLLKPSNSAKDRINIYLNFPISQQLYDNQQDTPISRLQYLKYLRTNQTCRSIRILPAADDISLNTTKSSMFHLVRCVLVMSSLFWSLSSQTAQFKMSNPHLIGPLLFKLSSIKRKSCLFVMFLNFRKNGTYLSWRW